MLSSVNEFLGNFRSMNSFYKWLSSFFSSFLTSFRRRQLTAAPAELEARQEDLNLKGLKNLGNTCFLNVILQSLAASPLFMDYLESIQETHSDSIVRELHHILEELQPFHKRLVPSLSPSRLFELIRAHDPQFHSYEQQDAHELLQTLFGILPETDNGDDENGGLMLPLSFGLKGGVGFEDSLGREEEGVSVGVGTLRGRMVVHGGEEEEIVSSRGRRREEEEEDEKKEEEKKEEEEEGGEGLVSSLSSSSPHSLMDDFTFKSSESAVENPCLGLLDSSMTCHGCSSRRPKHLLVFSVLSLPLPSPHSLPRPRHSPFSSSSSSSLLSSSSSSNPSVPLNNCMSQFSEPEILEQVECLACSTKAALRELHAILRTLSSSPFPSPELLAKKANVEQKIRKLSSTEPHSSHWEDEKISAYLQKLNFPLLRSPFRRTLSITRFPKLLILHFNRREIEAKNFVHVHFPFLFRPDPSSPTYNLLSVVEHHGGSNAGHYTLYRFVSEETAEKWARKRAGQLLQQKESDEEGDNQQHTEGGDASASMQAGRQAKRRRGTWFFISDTSVTKVPESRVQAAQAYMLFYEALA